MFNKKAFLFLFLLLIAIGTVSSVGASDVSDDAVSTPIDNDMGINEINEEKISEVNEPVVEEAISEEIGEVNDVVVNEVDEEEISDIDDLSLSEDKGGIVKETKDDGSIVISKKDSSKNMLGEEDWSKWSTFSGLNDNLPGIPENATLTLAINFYRDVDDDYIYITKPITIDGNGSIFDARGRGGVFVITSDDVILKNMIIRNAVEEDDSGAAVYIKNNVSYVRTIFDNCTFINNYAGGVGGAIYTSGELGIYNCTFTNNSAGIGGAIFAYYPLYWYESVYIVNSKFTGNKATTWGGAIFLYSDTINSGFANGSAYSYIRNTTFKSNSAGNSTEEGYGGAIYNFQYLELVDCNFISNKATGGGGAIYSNNGEYIQAGSDYYVQTFGIEISGKTSFINNTATKYGGAIKIYADPDYLQYGVKGILKVNGSAKFEGNYAKTGGALSVLDSNCSIVNAVFQSNRADKNGSAMEGGSATNCTFKNHAKPVTHNTKLTNAKILDLGKLTLKQSGSYYQGKTLTVTLTDTNTNKLVANAKVVVKFSNGKSVALTTNSKGVATYKIPFAPGTYTATATLSSSSVYLSSAVKLSNIKIAKIPITITPTALSTTYASGKLFQVKVINTATKKIVSGLKLVLKVYTGSKYKSVTVKTNAKGIATYAASTLAVGTHKIVVSNGVTATYAGSSKTSSVKVAKARYAVSAPAVKNAYKKSGLFKVTVKNSASKKVVNGQLVTVKVYTGNKFKAFNAKTNSKGIASIRTNTLTKGTHKVVVAIAANKNFNAASVSSKIVIA